MVHSCKLPSEICWELCISQMHGQPALGIILSNKYEGHWVYASDVHREYGSTHTPLRERRIWEPALTGFLGQRPVNDQEGSQARLP